VPRRLGGKIAARKFFTLANLPRVSGHFDFVFFPAKERGRMCELTRVRGRGQQVARVRRRYRSHV
jgi:hypothetical protein